MGGMQLRCASKSQAITFSAVVGANSTWVTMRRSRTGCKETDVGKRMSKNQYSGVHCPNTNVALGWVSMHGFASYTPMYWHVHDILDVWTMARIP